MGNLAIVIPAYKITFFPKVLESISNQTCKDFTVYIGVDGSADDFDILINSYCCKIPIVYKNFKENIGKKDLVAHWERCIDMTKEEEWLWLFSDDDVMESTCVESFYDTLSKNFDSDVFHFNILKINEQNEIIANCTPFPEKLYIEDFLIGRLKGIYSSTVLEYIFRKEHFINNDRFQNFDLGWGSDDATWIKLGKRRGIHTINNSMVYWRHSRFNISPDRSNISIVSRKLNAQIEFSKWVIKGYHSNEIIIEKKVLKDSLEGWFLESIKENILFFSFKNLIFILDKFYCTLPATKKSIRVTLLTLKYKVNATIKNRLKLYYYKMKLKRL